MSVSEKNVAQEHSFDRLVATVAALRKTIIVVVLALLALSACFNLYLFGENLSIKQKVKAQAGVRTQQDQVVISMYQVLRQLVAQLRSMSQNNTEVKELLSAFETPLAMFKLDAQMPTPPTGSAAPSGLPAPAAPTPETP